MKKKHALKLRKLTIMVPEELLDQALRESGEGIAATVQNGLRLICAQNAYKKLARMRGKVRYTLSVDELREE